MKIHHFILTKIDKKNIIPCKFKRKEKRKAKRKKKSLFFFLIILASQKGSYMIILNSQKNNTKFEENLKAYENMVNIPYIECPHCKSTDVIKWGSYTRTITYINGSKIITKVLKIQRIKCKKCNHTHALLLSFIIPYKRKLLDVILAAISNEDICLNYSYDTIEKWNKQFNKFLPYLKTIFYNISKIEIITRLKHNISKYYELFFSITNKILMMTRTAVVRFAHF